MLGGVLLMDFEGLFDDCVLEVGDERVLGESIEQTSRETATVWMERVSTLIWDIVLSSHYWDLCLSSWSFALSNVKMAARQ